MNTETGRHGPSWALVDSSPGDGQLTIPEGRFSKSSEKKRYSYSRTGILTCKLLGSRVFLPPFFLHFLHYLRQFCFSNFTRDSVPRRPASQLCGKMANTVFPIHRFGVTRLNGLSRRFATVG